MATINIIYAAADLRDHILGFVTDMKFPKAQDTWFTSFSEEASKTGLNIVYSTMIFFIFLSLFLNYSPYPASLSGDVLSSDFARRVMEFPFVETRYNEMQAYDGVSGDKYIISTVYAIYLKIFLVVMLLLQYLVLSSSREEWSGEIPRFYFKLLVCLCRLLWRFWRGISVARGRLERRHFKIRGLVYLAPIPDFFYHFLFIFWPNDFPCCFRSGQISSSKFQGQDALIFNALSGSRLGRQNGGMTPSAKPRSHARPEPTGEGGCLVLTARSEARSVLSRLKQAELVSFCLSVPGKTLVGVMSSLIRLPKTVQPY